MSPRLETGFRAGNERSILQTEAWFPIRQAPDRVLYGDIRLSGDNNQNREQNAGVGYRQMVGNAIYGVNGWADRRTTDAGSTFVQTTIGLEAFSHNLDARANFYIPLGDRSQTKLTGNGGRTAPYLAGTGLFVDTPDRITEEAQAGFDLELGTTVPDWNLADSARVYGGFYHFRGDETDSVTGWRARVTADVTPWLQVGARHQHDAERGSQTFLEATLRLPGKQSYKTSGLRARLDESPERDIDIVTGGQKENGLATPVLNAATGSAQRVIHVDNTAAPGGDGSAERPYNTLAAAQTAQQAYDVIYLRRGDGTTTGQNNGITISAPGVQLIGAGTDFIYDAGKFTTASKLGPRAAVIIHGGTDPVITNGGSNGVTVTADNVTVAGLSVVNPGGIGVQFTNTTQNWQSATVRDVSVSNAVNRGISVQLTNGATINDVLIENSFVNGTTGNGRGIEVNLTTGCRVVNATVRNSIVQNNANIGAIVWAPSASTIDNILMEGNTATGNTGDTGLYAQAGIGSRVGTVVIRNNTLSGNGAGISAYANSGGRLDRADIYNNTATGHTSTAIFARANVGGSVLGLANIYNNTTSGNIGRGIQVTAQTGATITEANVMDNIANGGTVNPGISIDSTGTSRIGTVTAMRNVANGNSGGGFVVSAATNGVIDAATLTDNTANQNTGRGLYMIAQSGGLISSVTATGNTANQNTGVNGMGMNILATGVGSRIETATASNNYFDSNESYGIEARGASNASIGTATLRSITAVNNVNHGIRFVAQSGATIQTANLFNNTGNGSTGAATNGIIVQTTGAGSLIGAATLTGNTTNNNNSHGTFVTADTAGVIGAASVSNAAAAGNLFEGLRFESNGANSNIVAVTVANAVTSNNFRRGTGVLTLNGGAMGNVSLSDIQSNGNSAAGVEVSVGNTAGAGGITSASLSRITARNNAQSGLYVAGFNTGAVSLALTASTFTNNQQHGVFIDDDTTGAWTVDLGGGALAGTGRNRIFGNTLEDIRVDMDGGQLRAQSNWWGQAGGPAGGEILLDSGTLDSTSPLAADPGQ